MIAIIGILATVVIASLNSARTSGRVAAIKSNLKNLQTQAIMYHADNGTFAGLCTYNTNGVTAHASIQPMIDALSSIAGESYVRCVVRTIDVPGSVANGHFNATDSLETKNFGVAVYFNNTHYGVDARRVITVDSSNPPGGTTGWDNAYTRCNDMGKELISVEILKAIYDIYGISGAGGFSVGSNWSSTLSDSSSNHAYYQNFNQGNVGRATKNTVGHVRCAS